jgi:hypothetical protein
MKKNRIATLPPIAVEERPEKVTLTMPPALRRSIDAFTEYFTHTAGAAPTSDNAVIIGILTGYFEDHGGFQRWLKAQARAGSQAAAAT